MATKKISEATQKSTLDATDMIPVAKSAEATAYYVTGQAIFNSLPAGSTSQAGIVELATKAEIVAGTSDKIVEAGQLANVLAGKHYMAVSSSPLTLANINSQFNSTFGRSPAAGDLITAKDSSNNYFILVYDATTPAWRGINATGGSFVSYV